MSFQFVKPPRLFLAFHRFLNLILLLVLTVITASFDCVAGFATSSHPLCDWFARSILMILYFGSPSMSGRTVASIVAHLELLIKPKRNQSLTILVSVCEKKQRVTQPNFMRLRLMS